ncbi:hypothetical protein ACFYNO_21520 [Kitasatospora sp. NPDC006697]|uniref:hypothetical protein n=1 Tax=Kitasatospora sp. NPDC006697 TaxID=3364020 RepID=UPI0036BCD99D
MATVLPLTLGILVGRHVFGTRTPILGHTIPYAAGNVLPTIRGAIIVALLG